ncbi:MAG: hypothetical protein LBF77_05210 [Spirochaetaceae bacterium]|nr:hypothetical protein [Spirochaetaceae bacterium]
MTTVKPGSPAFRLGIFFILCFSLPVFGEEEAGPCPVPPKNRSAAEYTFSPGGGSLWVDGERGSGFWAASLSLKGGPWYAAIGSGGVFSNLPAFDTDYTGAWFNAGLDAAPLGFDLSGGFFHRDVLNAEVFGVRAESGGADGYFLNFALPLRFGSWSIAPSFLFAQGFWKDGDLYWFFGKPRIPVFFAAGLSAAFREEHRLYIQYLSLNLNILSPSDENLFTSHFDGIVAAYTWSFNRKPFSLDTALGWFSVSGGLNGSLSSGNQPYYLFPYIFYDAAFDARFHALFGLLEAEYRRGIFRLKTSLGAAHIFRGEIGISAHSKQKTLFYLGIPFFDGREEFYSRSIDPGGLGAAFLSVEGGLAELPLGRRFPYRERRVPRLSLTAKKSFAVPWGYENILASGFIDRGKSGEEPVSAGGDLNLAGILLSGISFSCSIAW